MGTVRFEILGSLRAWHEDQELDLGPGKQRAVLAVLLLHSGRPVSTTRIIEAVWAEAPPANGPNVVQKYVAGLRRVLEPKRSPRTPGQVLTLTDAGYLLRAGPDEVDVLRFEQRIRQAQVARAGGRREQAVSELLAAFELWGGEPFPGLTGHLFDSARHRLIELRTTALETWAHLELELGRHRELVGELVPLIAQFPLREQLCYLLMLMLTLYRDGRQAEALAAFRDLQTRLRDEHGLEPGEAVQELHRRILRSDPTLAPPGQPGPPDPPTQPVHHGPPDPPTQPVHHGPPDPPTQPVHHGPPVLPGPPAALPVPIPQFAAESPPAGSSRVWYRHLGTVAGTGTALLSFGLLTGLVILGYAAWRHSWRLALAGAGYLLLGAMMFVVMASEDPEADPTVLGASLLAGQLISWLFGTVHVILLNPSVRAAISRHSTEPAAERERRVRREQARYLLHHYPAARGELRLGRPDLPHSFDDGGLIDINAVPEQVVAALPGLSTTQCRQIVMDRSLRGPYASLEDLAGRCLLPLSVVNRLRELLFFLPPQR